jgi:hypothetical protein
MEAQESPVPAPVPAIVVSSTSSGKGIRKRTAEQTFGSSMPPDFPECIVVFAVSVKKNGERKKDDTSQHVSKGNFELPTINSRLLRCRSVVRSTARLV